MKAGRVVLVVLGSLAVLVALALLAGGGALLWVSSLKDEDGYLTTSAERFETTSYAIASESLDVGGEGPDWLFEPGRLGTIRLSGASAEPAGEIFIGIAPAEEASAYLAGVEHDVVVELDYAPFDVEYTREEGSSPPAPPREQDFWAASAQGSGTHALEWDVEGGTWAVVLMNADGSEGVAADLRAGARVPFLLAVAIGLLAGGTLLLLGGGAMIFFGARGAAGPAPEALTASEAGPAPPAPGYPVAVEGRLDEPLSRWLWLVKWLLALPHWVVLVFLWIAFVVMTVVAFFAILFTERYPRSIFDFNVGVLRWTWRVAFYSYSVLATDRYPPFSLGPEPGYPATLDVAYPERLSRGLVLVKWWLLAVPHYLVVGIFQGGWGFGWDWGDGWEVWGPGLIGLLVLFAAVALLFRGRYPRSIFELVLGVNRWSYRVLAYAALMRDEYPPFRLAP